MVGRGKGGKGGGGEGGRVGGWINLLQASIMG